MAKKFLTDIDLSKNELLNAVMQKLINAPQDPKQAQLYYDTGDLIMYQYNGTEWRPVGKVYVQGNGILISASDQVSADFATSSEATAGTSTTKVMSPSLVKAVIQTLDATGFAEGAITENGASITIYGLKETDGKLQKDANNNLVIKIDSNQPYDANDNPIATKKTVTSMGTSKTVTLEEGNESATTLTSYTLKQGGTTVGTINIPKFLVVKSGVIVTGTWNGTSFTEDSTQPGSGSGKALKLVLNDSGDSGTDDDVLYINVADLCDVYTAGVGVTITAGNVVKVKLKSETAHTASSAEPSNTAGRQYAVGVDADGNLSVNVPWTDTTYTNAKLGQGYGTCTTAEATTAKSVTLSSYALVTGGVVAVKFTNAVPANATMNINSKGAKSIYYKGSAIPAGLIKAGDVAFFMFDGTQYHLLGTDRSAKNAVVGASVSGKVITFTYADGSTSTVTTQDTVYTHPAGSAASKTGVPTANQAPGFGGTFKVNQISTDSTSHVSAVTERTITIPETEATQSAKGLMSAADKAKLDSVNKIPASYQIANPSLTPSNGVATWQITATQIGGDDPTSAILILRDSNGNEVIADVAYSSAGITVSINASTTIAAGAYTALIQCQHTV